MNTIRNYFKTPANSIIITLTVLVFIIELILSRNAVVVDLNVLIDMGGKFNPLIDDGQYLRFFAPIFLHSGWFHLVSNMITLYFIGAAAERQFGTPKFLSIYLISGIIGNVFSYLFNSNADYLVVSVGASTAIFGVFGMLIMYGMLFWNQNAVRVQTTTFLIFVGWSIFTQINSATIDIWGHIGGLVGGFLLAFVYGFKNPDDSKRIMPIQRYVAIGALILIFFVVFMVVRP